MHRFPAVTAVFLIFVALRACGLCLAAEATPTVATPLPLPAWAFPGVGAAQTEKTAADEILTVRGSTARFTRAEATNAFAPPDWRPDTHPPMPPTVEHGRAPKVMACGYCHLPDGGGRPENARLAGLPAAYIVQEIAAMASGMRRSAAGDDDAPTKAMTQLAHELTPTETEAVAAYFSAVEVPPKQTVRENDIVPATKPYHYLAVLQPGNVTEPIAGRFLEACTDFEAHERRDPRVEYVAYVPTGSVERGRSLALRGPDGPATSCLICHGPELKGTPQAPPLAGQFGAYVLRQLLSFRNRTRTGPATALMQPVVAKLTIDDMVALSAYVAATPR